MFVSEEVYNFLSNIKAINSSEKQAKNSKYILNKYET